MLEMLMQWYRRRFSDPEAIALLVILLAGFGIMFFFSAGCWAPLLVAIVLAYLLEWPTVRLERIGLSRTWATSLVLVLFVGILLLMAFVVMPVAWQQGIYLIAICLVCLNRLSDFAATLPRRYPALMDAGIIDAMADNMRSRMPTVGDSVVKYSLASLVGLLTLAVYLVLVPLMVFFPLKINSRCSMPYAAYYRVIAAWRAGVERDEPADYQLYPRQGAGDDCRRRRHLDRLHSLRSQLLAAAGGAGGILGADSVYRRFVVTIPVVGVALFQFGAGTEFWTPVCRIPDNSGAGWQPAGAGSLLGGGEFTSAGDYSVGSDFRRAVGFLGYSSRFRWRH